MGFHNQKSTEGTPGAVQPLPERVTFLHGGLREKVQNNTTTRDDWSQGCFSQTFHRVFRPSTHKKRPVHAQRSKQLSKSVYRPRKSGVQEAQSTDRTRFSQDTPSNRHPEHPRLPVKPPDACVRSDHRSPVRRGPQKQNFQRVPRHQATARPGFRGHHHIFQTLNYYQPSAKEALFQKPKKD